MMLYLLANMEAKLEALWEDMCLWPCARGPFLQELHTSTLSTLRVDMPKPMWFGGKSDAMDLNNFLWFWRGALRV